MRPTFGAEARSRDTREALAVLLNDLQLGWDEHDADITDRHHAADIVWGSPFGASIRGYDSLHPIHARLKTRASGGPRSRFEVVEAVAPTNDVVVAQIRRNALADGDDAFSEMAMYVLVRRAGTWWLAAAQNTPIRDEPKLRFASRTRA